MGIRSRSRGEARMHRGSVAAELYPPSPFTRDAVRTTMAVAVLKDALVELIREDPQAATHLLGTPDAARFAMTLDQWCCDVLGASVGTVEGWTLSVGATFELTLTDARRVVVKVLRPEVTASYAAAMRRVQRHLVDVGFPCPTP